MARPVRALVVMAVAVLLHCCLLSTSATYYRSAQLSSVDKMVPIPEGYFAPSLTSDDAPDEGEERISDLEIRDILLGLLEDIKAGLSLGYPDLGIPPLDPFVLGDIPFNVSWDDNSVYGNLTNAELINLSQYITTQVVVDIQFSLAVTIALEQQKLELKGAYNMDGNVVGFNVYGDGDFRIDLDDLRFGFYMYLGLANFGKYVQVKNMTADFLLKTAEVQFEHLLGGGIQGGLANQALSQVLPSVLGDVEALVLPPVMQLLMDKTNEYLKQFPLIPDFNITRFDNFY